MLRLVVLSFIVAAASAQHHVDPFAGSGCDCASFCSGKCAINATVRRLCSVVHLGTQLARIAGMG
jgi:hypothetical protein